MIDDLKRIIAHRVRITSKQRHLDPRPYMKDYYANKMNAYNEVLNLIDVLKKHTADAEIQQMEDAGYQNDTKRHDPT